MATLADYFAGVTGCAKFSQILQLEMIPNAGTVTDTETGEVTTVIYSYTRNLYAGKYETRTYVFEGVPVEMVQNLSGNVTVTEVDGTSHLVHLDQYVKDGSTGTAIFENDSNAVNIIRTSPHMRTVEVTRRIGALMCNDKEVKPAPGWHT